MQLGRQPVTNGPAWIESTPLPRSLPQALPVTQVYTEQTLFVGREGHRGQFGTETVELGIQGQEWRTGGSFEQAVAAAKELSKALPGIWSGTKTEAGTLGVVRAEDGWRLLRVGSGITDDRLSSPYSFTPATGKTPAVIRKTNDALLAIVSPTRWIDFRDVPAS